MTFQTPARDASPPVQLEPKKEIKEENEEDVDIETVVRKRKNVQSWSVCVCVCARVCLIECGSVRESE